MATIFKHTITCLLSVMQNWWLCDFSFWFKEKSQIFFPKFWKLMMSVSDVLWSEHLFFFFFFVSSFPVVVKLIDLSRCKTPQLHKNCRAAELSMPHVHPESSPWSQSIHVCKIFMYITSSNLSNLNSFF